MTSRARTWTLLGVCACAYLYAFPYQPELNNPNENVRFYMTAAIVEEHSYIIDALRARWGWVNDAAVKDGHAYSVKAPGASELGVPGYWLYAQVQRARGLPIDRVVALWVCRVTGSVLPALLFLFFLHRWLLRRVPSEPVLADATVFAIGLGSLLYGYGMMFVSHTQSAAAAFGAFALLEDARTRRTVTAGRAFLAGLLAAGVTWLEYPGVFASLVLSIYALFCLRPWKRVVPFGLGALVPTLLVMHFQWKAFGNPLTPGHLYVENPAFRAEHQHGFFGADGFHVEAFGLIFNRGFGLLALTPLLVFAVLGLPRLLAKRGVRPDAIASLMLVLLSFGAIVTMRIWRGGWTLGPRYLALMVPFVAWWAMEGLALVAARSRVTARALAIGTCAAGLVASGIPSLYYPHLPEELTRPLPQLFAVLIAHDYAPTNALSWLETYGSLSMLPLALLATGALAWMTWQSTKGASSRVGAASVMAVGAALVGCVALLPAGLAPDEEPVIRATRAFIVAQWQPAGHDLASQLEAQVRAPGADAATVQRLEQRLADVYEREGRTREALRARRRAGLGAP